MILLIASLFILICLSSAITSAAADPVADWFSASKRDHKARLLQGLAGDGNVADPFALMDGVSSITYSPGNSSTKTFGHFDIPNKIPMMEDAHIPIGSNSKLYTAVAIYQLHEQGLLDVDADIATMLDEKDFENFGIAGVTKYCPQLGFSSAFNQCQKMTLRHLLSMSSGIYPQLNCDAVAATATQCNVQPYFVNPGSIAHVVGTFILEPLIFEPGAQYHYSNPNFILATYFVEKYSGLTFQKYLETNIFSKIGMNDTYYDFFNQQLVLDEKRVKQYYKIYDNATYDLLSVGAATLELDLGAVAGTGGLVSTLQDEVTFFHSLFNRTTKGAPLLSNASSQEAILAPRSYVGTASIPGLADIFMYFGQGIVVACSSEGCPNGPNWITYTGGTLTVTTANLMDYNSYIMSQVWTTTRVLATTAEDFEKAKERQTGSLEDFEDWIVPQVDPTLMSVQQLLAVVSLGGSGLNETSPSDGEEPTSSPSNTRGLMNTTPPTASSANEQGIGWATTLIVAFASAMLSFWLIIIT